MKTKLIIHTDEISKTWIDRAVELGVDVLGIHPVGNKEAHKNLENDLITFASPTYRGLVDYANSKGLSVEYELHAASFLLPRELFETHPDYFRMDENGRRIADFNFCVSNQAALHYVAERAVTLSEKLYGSAPNYFFWLDDVKGCFCYCPKCRALTPSEQNLTAMNAIIKALRKKNTSAKLAYLAYYECIKAPQKVKPETGIFLEYAPFERDMKKSSTAVSDGEKKNMKALLDFFGAENSWVLEYWFDNSFFSRHVKPPLPFTPDNETIKSDIVYYLESGFENISSFACFLGADYEKLFGTPNVTAIKK